MRGLERCGGVEYEYAGLEIDGGDESEDLVLKRDCLKLTRNQACANLGRFLILDPLSQTMSAFANSARFLDLYQLSPTRPAFSN